MTFHIFTVNTQLTFSDLSRYIDFEHITKGRKGNTLVLVDLRGIPIVRTTTKYTKLAHNFTTEALSIRSAVMQAAVDALNAVDALDFNNAMVEIYDSDYKKMGYHSDQSLDLEDGSYIAIYSCYEDPTGPACRKLVVVEKRSETGLGLEQEFVLTHNSVILFSLETNRNYQHKIVTEGLANNRWLGYTFRKSKTYLNIADQGLVLANKEQEKEFYRLRRLENTTCDFVYPDINYTLSPSDLIPVC